jgi:hypothetical protein
LKRNLLRILISTLAMAAILFGLHQGLMSYFIAGHFKGMLALAVTIAVAIGVYFGLIFLQKVIDVGSIKQSLKGEGI